MSGNNPPSSEPSSSSSSSIVIDRVFKAIKFAILLVCGGIVLYALVVCSFPDKLKALMAALSGYLAWRKVMEISGKGGNNISAALEAGGVVLIFIAYALFSHDNWHNLWIASVIIGGVFLISMMVTIYIASRTGVAETGKGDYKFIDLAALMVSFNSFMTLSTTVFGPMLLKLFGH